MNRAKVSTWIMAVVLEGVCMVLFEPIEEVLEKFLTFKTLFFLPKLSFRRVGHLVSCNNVLRI